MPAPPGNRNAVGNRGGWRPSRYRPEFAEQAWRLLALGRTDADLGRFFGVWPVDGQVTDELRGRLHAYAEKAMREAAVRMVQLSRSGDFREAHIPGAIGFDWKADLQDQAE